MATVTNSFGILDNDDGFIRNEKKSKGSVGKYSSDDTETETFLPRTPTVITLPSSRELEKTAKSTTDVKERIELWINWKDDILYENKNNVSKYEDATKKNVRFRNHLINTQAIERSIETCFDCALNEEQGQALLSFLQVCFPNTDAFILEKLVYGTTKISDVLQDNSTEIVNACKRTLCDIIAIIKKINETKLHGSSWNKGKKSNKNDKYDKDKNQMRSKDNRSNVDVAAESFKNATVEVDETRSKTIEGAELLTSSAENSIQELNALFSALTEAPVHNNDTFRSTKSSKKKIQTKNGSKSQISNTSTKASEALKKEEESLIEKENMILDEINDLNEKIKNLEENLAEIRILKENVTKKKLNIKTDVPMSNINMAVSERDQSEILSCFQSIVTKVNSTFANKENIGEVNPSVMTFYNSLKSLLVEALDRQGELEDKVSFLVESLQRRKMQEAQMSNMSAIQRKKDLLRESKIKIAEIENELKNTLFEASTIYKKSDKAMTEFHARESFLKKNVPDKDCEIFGKLSNDILKKHAEISSKASEKDKKIEPVKTQKDIPRKENKSALIQSILREETERVQEEYGTKKNEISNNFIDGKDEYDDNKYHSPPLNHSYNKSNDSVDEHRMHPHTYEPIGNENSYVHYAPYNQGSNGNNAMNAVPHHVHPHPHQYSHHIPPPPPHHHHQPIPPPPMHHSPYHYTHQYTQQQQQQPPPPPPHHLPPVTTPLHHMSPYMPPSPVSGRMPYQQYPPPPPHPHPHPHPHTHTHPHPHTHNPHQPPPPPPHPHAHAHAHHPHDPYVHSPPYGIVQPAPVQRPPPTAENFENVSPENYEIPRPPPVVQQQQQQPKNINYGQGYMNAENKKISATNVTQQIRVQPKVWKKVDPTAKDTNEKNMSEFPPLMN